MYCSLTDWLPFCDCFLIKPCLLISTGELGYLVINIHAVSNTVVVIEYNNKPLMK